MSQAPPTTSESDVQSWLEDIKHEKPEKLDLRRDFDGGRLASFTWDASSLTDITGRIMRAAQRDGAARPLKVVTYTVRAERTGGDADGISSCTVVVPGASSKEGDKAPDDFSPNVIGLFTHLLRQNTELHRLLLSSHEGRTLALERQLLALEARNDDANKRHMVLLRLSDDLAMAKLERETQAATQKLEEKRLGYAIEKFDHMLPIALNRLFGGGPGKGLAAKDELLDALLGKMSADRIAAIMSGEPFVLSEQERMIFAELYTSAGAKHKARNRPLHPDEPAKDGEEGAAT
jgi:hypothetical protein